MCIIYNFVQLLVYSFYFILFLFYTFDYFFFLYVSLFVCTYSVLELL